MQINGIDYELLRLTYLAATTHGIDPALLAGIIAQESGWNPQADGDFQPAEDGPDEQDGVRGEYWSHGLGQLHRRGAGAAFTRTQLYDPTANTMAAAAYLWACLDTFGGDVQPAVCAYNAGIAYVQAHGWGWNQDRYVLPVLASRAAWRRPMEQAAILAHCDAIWGLTLEMDRGKAKRIRCAHIRAQVAALKRAVGLD